MTTTKLTFTKQIRGGKLRATEMEVGASVTGTLVGFNEVSGTSKDGRSFSSSNVIVNVNGNDVEIYPAGNLKFLKKNVEQGKNTVGQYIIITRDQNKEIKGRSTSQFTIQQDQNSAADTQPSQVSVKTKLQEIRAK